MMRGHFLSLAIVIIVGIVAFTPSLKLSFVGDDWLAFYRFRYHLGDWSNHQFNYLTYFLTPYGAQDMAMGLLQKVFGYYSQAYFAVSFILRLGVAFTLYWFLSKFTLNKLARLFAASFFIVTTIGLDATNWVFNMPSYLSLILFLFFTYSFMRSQLRNSYKYALICVPLYYLAFVFAPIRMHGLPMIALALDVLLILKRRNLRTLKLVVIRQILLIATLLFIKNTGQSMGLDALEKLSEGVRFMIQAIQKGNLTFLLTPFIIVGRFFIPETIWPLVRSHFPNPIIRHIAPFALLFFSPLILFFKQLESQVFKTNKYTLFLVSALLGCTAVISFFAKTNPSTIITPEIIGPALMGGYFLVFSVILILRYSKEEVSHILYFSTVWTFISFLYPYFWSPYAYLRTTHRYLIVSAVGFSLFWGVLASLARGRKLQFLIIFVFVIFLSIHISSTNLYFSNLVSVRGTEISNKIWQLLPKIEGLGSGKEPMVFYFEGDSAIIYHAITFGFPPHMALLYNINEREAKLPVPLSSWEDVITTVTTGKNMPAYGYPVKPISINNIYAFRITSNEVKNITLEKQLLLQKLLTK